MDNENEGCHSRILSPLRLPFRHPGQIPNKDVADGEKLRVGRKAFKSQDAFVSYLEMSVSQLRPLKDNASACKVQADSARVMFEEAVEAVDNLTIKDFDIVADPYAAFVAVAVHRLGGLTQHKVRFDLLADAAANAQIAVDDLIANLKDVRKVSK